jgi:hypothetical protein
MRRRPGPLAALLAAEVVSTTGSQMTLLALPWFVLVTTGSPARMGVVVAADLLPMVALRRSTANPAPVRWSAKAAGTSAASGGRSTVVTWTTAKRDAGGSEWSLTVPCATGASWSPSPAR